MVAPDGDAGEAGVEAAGAQGQLALGAVLVQPHERMEVCARQPRSVLHADERVGVAGVAHHQHLAVHARHLVQCPALPITVFI